MAAYFIRSNGDTLHNNARNPALYVRGEPPVYPARSFNYLRECLDEGFARVGWPGTGDLRHSDWQTVAREIYGNLMPPEHVRYLEKFAGIRTGDLILVPAGTGGLSVHLGRVVRRSRPGSDVLPVPNRLAAYYYHHDVAAGDWYENAHRVDVVWHRAGAGTYAEFDFDGMGGLWPKAFRRVLKAESVVERVARRVGLVE